MPNIKSLVKVDKNIVSWLQWGKTSLIRITNWFPVKQQGSENLRFVLREASRLSTQHIPTYVDWRNNKASNGRIECALFRRFKITKELVESDPEFCLCLSVWSTEEPHVNLS